MSSEWLKTSFADLIAQGVLEIGDGYRAKNDELGGEGIIFLRAGHVRDTYIDFSEADQFKNEDEAKFRGKIAKPGDVVITTKGNSTGRVAFVTSEMPRFVYSPHLSYWRSTCETKLAQGFIRAWSRSQEFMVQLGAMSRSTDMAPYLSLTDQRRLTITLPPSDMQQAIAAFLDAVESRIDLLRETNATLEAITQALFKSWFVDFDPVHAKAEGRALQGLDAEISGLFPSSFEESALGPVPNGWKVSTLVEHIRAERGLSYKGAGLCSAEEGRPMHNLNSVYEGGGYKYPGIKFYKGDFKDRHIVRAGDIIVTNTEQGHEHRLIGFPAVVPEAYDNGIFSHHLYRLTIRNESPLTSPVLYYLLMSPNVREQVIGCANGSTVNMLKIHGMEIPRFVCPPATIARAFEDLTLPLRKQIELNVGRAQTLMTMRDVLLPKLISGRIRLTEAEALIREAA